ncbi:hypothetical protein CGRA01v4_13638 [Colletotrichum graminicola]|nr:hypothetical protein CGRA01v4_13638 [Colletotrichum graminicola]
MPGTCTNVSFAASVSVSNNKPTAVGINISSTMWPEAGKRTLSILVISLQRRRARYRSGRSIVYVQYDGVGCSATICIIHAAQQDDGFTCASKTFI